MELCAWKKVSSGSILGIVNFRKKKNFLRFFFFRHILPDKPHTFTQNFKISGIMELEVIKSKIYEIRGQKVMLDRDLAQMYGVETKNLNKAVKRNLERFEGEDFMFQLTKDECLRFQIGTLNGGRGQHLKYLPYAFTEMGVAMLSSVLHSDTAIIINRSIMRAFVIMRSYMSSVSAVTSELSELKERILTIEQTGKDNAEAISDLSEDIQKELDDIYLALSQLAARQKENDSLKERQKIGFKK